MSRHACLRCGLESGGSSWPDRHPAATTLIAIPTIYTLVGVVLAYPWFCIPLLVVGAAVWVERRQRQRASIAARADYEYRESMIAAMRDVPPPYSLRDRQRRPRGADHWSPTQPIRSGGAR